MISLNEYFCVLQHKRMSSLVFRSVKDYRVTYSHKVIKAIPMICDDATLGEESIVSSFGAQIKLTINLRTGDKNSLSLLLQYNAPSLQKTMFKFLFSITFH